MKKIIQECIEYIRGGAESVKADLFKKRSLRLAEINVDEVELYILNNKELSFNELLFRMIDRINQKDSDVYKKARIDRRLFSKIRSSKKYIPSKKTVLALCLALELSRSDTLILLKSAGYSLSNSDDYDLAISFFISKEIYDFYKINEILYELGFDVF